MPNLFGRKIEKEKKKEELNIDSFNGIDATVDNIDHMI